MFRSEYKGIGIDVDGTFCCHERELEEKVNEKFGTAYGPENPLYVESGYNLRLVAPRDYQYYEKDIAKIMRDQEIYQFIQEQYKNEFLVENLRLAHPRKFKVLQQLAAVRPVYILTAREKEIFKQTVDIFRRKAGAVVGVVRTGGDKSWWCYGLNLSVLMDDRPDIIREVLANSDTKVVMVKHSYNEGLEPSERLIPVKDFEEGVEKIYEMWKGGEI